MRRDVVAGAGRQLLIENGGSRAVGTKENLKQGLTLAETFVPCGHQAFEVTCDTAKSQLLVL
jgi:hypothetical protein